MRQLKQQCHMNKIAALIFFSFSISSLRAEDGYRLWLRYDKIANEQLLRQYSNIITSISVNQDSETLGIAMTELRTGLEGLLGKPIKAIDQNGDIALIAGSPTSLPVEIDREKSRLGNEGFLIRTIVANQKQKILITGNTHIAILYGVFHFLRVLQTHQDISRLNIVSSPLIKHRVLNHWDNLNRTVERGYAGISIWDWHKLPDYLDQRYTDYARANASIGINGAVLTNVNANALILTNNYLAKFAALANLFRPFGIKVYLTARFNAPMELGKLKTADPLDPEVKAWWKRKIDSIYRMIPDFGGFLVKANSEGQPGPQNYQRSHADGANMLADIVAPHNGLVMWRAFVYSNEIPEDRFKQAYNEFQPLDGKFRSNVLVQVKNGPIDFQPREPFHPLFGSMPQTPLMLEFQLTQEYLGQATHLVYQAPLYKECLDADTYRKGMGSFVSKSVDGSLEGKALSGIAGVANIGNDRNWTGHIFGQANWYAFGRLSWNHSISSEDIAAEWIRQTFSNETNVVRQIRNIMMASREAVVNYMTPLGLHHIMATGHHYGPGPWVDNAGRMDWNPVYYHKADSAGIGFDRTGKGSNAVAQYAHEVREQFQDLKLIPEKYLLWFHHVPWTHITTSGRTLWKELCFRYNAGVDTVMWMQKTWSSLKSDLDPERFRHVQMFLNIQLKEAIWWRDACLSYFQAVSGLPIPSNYQQPAFSIGYYKSLRFPFSPGIGGNP